MMDDDATQRFRAIWISDTHLGTRKRSLPRRAGAIWTAWCAGTSHKAEIRRIGGVLYCNDGDWVESLTALVETLEGELKIVHWHELARADVLDDDEETTDAHPDRDRRLATAG